MTTRSRKPAGDDETRARFVHRYHGEILLRQIIWSHAVRLVLFSRHDSSSFARLPFRSTARLDFARFFKLDSSYIKGIDKRRWGTQKKYARNMSNRAARTQSYLINFPNNNNLQHLCALSSAYYHASLAWVGLRSKPLHLHTNGYVDEVVHYSVRFVHP